MVRTPRGGMARGDDVVVHVYPRTMPNNSPHIEPVPFPYDRLSRWPDPIGTNLFAADATDRLLIDTAAPTIREAETGCEAETGRVVIIGDRYGALTLAAASLGARGIRTHQDSYSGHMALHANSEKLGIEPGSFTSLPLSAELLTEADIVLMQLPKDLAQLDHWASLIAAHAAPSVRIFAGGRIKHMTTGMNAVLSKHFTNVSASLARQKSRLLLASGVAAGDGAGGVGAGGSEGAGAGRKVAGTRATGAGAGAAESAGGRDASVGTTRGYSEQYDPELDLWVCSYPGAFAAGRVDHGTRMLAQFIQDMPAGDGAGQLAADLGCGTGLLTATLLRAHPNYHVIATDRSAVAVRSATATLQRNLPDSASRYTVRQDHALFQQADASLDLIVCNPPFHAEASISTALSELLFREAARTLRPGGIMLTVFNSHLPHRQTLERVVGATEQLGRNRKFTVTRTVNSRAA